MNKDIYAKLKKLAPSVAFSTSREPDLDCVWDGDGPDPRDDGFDPYIVVVTARTVHSGEILEEYEYLSGSYFKGDEPIGDVHGYLPQMLKEATNELMLKKELLPRDGVYRQLELVHDYLTKLMRERWEEQQTKC